MMSIRVLESKGLGLYLLILNYIVVLHNINLNNLILLILKLFIVIN
jgi:hypothetical protein